MRNPSGPVPAPAASAGPGRRQQKIGRVVSNKMQKTIVVAVESLKKHRIYKKTYKVTKRFKAHDETNAANMGDLVRIEETRPLSKEKCWRLVEILVTSAQTPPVEEVSLVDVDEQVIGGSSEDEEDEER
jgi:small subunit ribosomal protein S17